MSKPKKTRCPVEVRATRLTSNIRVANPQKFGQAMRLFDRVAALKNRMSAYCFDHLRDLIADPYAFKAQYKAFNDNADLNAWETQALFHDVVDFYVNSFQQRLERKQIFVQGGWKATRYQKNVYRKPKAGEYAETGSVLAHAKGDPKSFELVRRKTHMTGIVKYLCYMNQDTFDPERMANTAMQAVLLFCRHYHPLRWQRACRVAQAIQDRMIGGMKLIHFTTGSHRRHPVESKSLVIEDPGNGKYRWWYQLRLGKGKGAEFVHLPLLFNAQRKKPEDLRLDAAHVCYVRNGKQFMVGATYEAPPLAFPPTEINADTSVGIDVNTKNNLMALSTGKVYDYDRSAVGALILLVNKITRNGTPNMTFRERARWEKLCRVNEWQIKRLIHDMLDALQAVGVTDLMVEDLDMRGDATFLEHHALKIKYSRLLRLLRLSHLKDWIGSQAEKRGMRLHRTDPAYTSQECPECHFVDRGNRPAQETFECLACGCAGPADTVAACNTQFRVLADVPRGKNALLHTFDVYGRAVPKPMPRLRIKGIVERKLYPPASPGHFTEPLGPGSTNKVGAKTPAFVKAEAPPQSL
ncbi:MAG: transposase [Planctomycetia bacterium]|nr:transposase [Planctomycetia bacterium]